ncbi:MAG: hypothetical protein LUQ15_03745, partial [Methanothrix sp.]|nr:hypothetical protein [Methanothrix sp.]
MELRIELIDPADRRSAGGADRGGWSARGGGGGGGVPHRGYLWGRIDAGGTAARTARDKAAKGRKRAKR